MADSGKIFGEKYEYFTIKYVTLSSEPLGILCSVQNMEIFK